jgi:L-lactate dehydrogenase complex protein LldG
MDDRKIILDKLYPRRPGAGPPAYHSELKVSLDEMVTRFTENLRTAGGSVMMVEKNRVVDAVETILQDSEIVVNQSNITIANDQLPQTIKDFKTANHLDILILDGEMGVAENGAVWVPEDNLGDRRFPFIAERVLIILEKHCLVYDLSEAYQEIDLNKISFGLWIAGPSKTADIEQSLVIGAQGASRHTVIITG